MASGPLSRNCFRVLLDEPVEYDLVAALPKLLVEERKELRNPAAKRIRRAYAWRTLMAAGARLAGGSDFPVERESPLLGIYAAVTRQDLGGQPAEGWYPEQRLTRREALQLFTGDAAYAAFAEARRGRIAPGFDADLTILDRDLLADGLPPTEILKSKIVMTLVGGEIVHPVAFAERSRIAVGRDVRRDVE